MSLVPGSTRPDGIFDAYEGSRGDGSMRAMRDSVMERKEGEEERWARCLKARGLLS